ncbi:MAG: hypothetical protein KUG72_03640 [Pseudomonadales bacterium]|nr:hypothetical protein [Pseudomonadales bacterium]
MRLITSILIAFLCSTSIYAEVINSSFGFSIEIPDTWQPLTGEEIKKNPDLFDFDNLSGVDKGLLDQIRPMILSGKMEVFFMANGTDDFTDNINVIKQVGRVLTDSTELAPLCESFPQQLSSMFNRPIKAYRCETTKVANLTGLYLEFDGVISGTRSMQYHIPKSDNVYLVVTATVNNKTYDEMSKKFHRVMETFRVK